MIDFEWYRSFVAIYQTETSEAAAKQRGLTDSEIMQELAALEQALKLHLFERHPVRLLPTAAGQALYAQVVGAVEQLQRSSQLRQLNTTQFDLTIGLPRPLFYTLGLTRLALADLSKVRLDIAFDDSSKLLRRLLAFERDLVVLREHLPHGEVVYLPLIDERLVLVGPPDLSLPDDLAPEAAGAWFEQQRWLVQSNDLPLVRRYWQTVFRRRPMLTPTLVMPDALGLARAVSLGMGISVLPDYLCRAHLDAGELRVLWQTETAPKTPLYVAVRRDSLHSRAVIWFLKHFELEA